MNEIAKRSVTVDMANRFGMEPQAFEATLRATVVPGNCSKEQFAAFLLVAKQYELNPITREIYAFPSKGGIQPIVGVDGWAKIINSHPQFDGMDFEDALRDFGDDKGILWSITCKIFRKDRAHPISVTEYMRECARDTDPWKKWPARMLRHKAMIQCARYAFGFSGIIDPDEAERFIPAAREVTPPPPPTYPGATVIKPEDRAQVMPFKEALKESLKIEPDTGEIIDDEIPEPIDPDDFLNEMEAAMSQSATPQYLNEIWADYKETAKGLFPPDQEKAEKIYEKHRTRLLKGKK